MRFSDLENKTIGLWGLGRETRSLLDHATRLKDARIGVVVREDTRDDVAELVAHGVTVVTADEAVEALRGYDVLVRSPGVSIHRPQMRELLTSGIVVTTATSLWLAERQGVHVIGVTGTKGKSTTATMIRDLLDTADRTVHLAGNIGLPALDLLNVPPEEWVVVELSSYQIADLTWGPQIAVITNLFKEHVDWHGSEAAYRTDKLRLFALPGVETGVIPAGVPDIASALAGCGRVVRYGGHDGWHPVADGISDSTGRRMSTSALRLRGAHNRANLCAALAALDAAGFDRPALPRALETLRPLPHRLETVLDARGIEWVDDSISTTPESTIAALAAYPERRIVLIGGGQDRQQDYHELATVLASRDAVVLGLPVTGARLVAALHAAGVPVERAHEVCDMKAAVREAQAAVAVGSVVLLSPAAPSYNQYRSFEERGNHFAALARAAIDRSRSPDALGR